MRRILLPLLISMIALPVLAEGRDQSYVTYQEDGTVVVQNDGRQISARVNMPVFPGDEIRTARDGRAEVRLADGNVIALDRSTDLQLRSILDSYDGASEQTVVQLVYGRIMVHRVDRDSSALRLDTNSASYLSSRYGIYSVDTDGRGNDLVSVHAGSVEVRTPSGTTRLGEGEQVALDDSGIYRTRTLASVGISDFEQWYLRRAERYDRSAGKYLRGDLAYAESELDSYGNWVYVSDYSSWVWRPYVSVGWRPYYSGQWMYGLSGCLVWESWEPWGWVPYHYGRWAFTPMYGWVWLPGYEYSPAWVYWMYGPGYVGWIPSGWYDCYRPYYGWLYGTTVSVSRPSRFGVGFYGRVDVGNLDLNQWTFVNPDTLVSRRVDQVALTTDAVRGRLHRDGASALVSNSPFRLSRNELKDPTTAIDHIVRRGIGSGTGTEGSGSAPDVTSFIRRDPELSSALRERITRPMAEPRADGGVGPASTPERIRRPAGAAATTSDPSVAVPKPAVDRGTER
ncbi:MAG: FecR family protein, partial [Thermoanaerobaculia bacterium]